MSKKSSKNNQYDYKNYFSDVLERNRKNLLKSNKTTRRDDLLQIYNPEVADKLVQQWAAEELVTGTATCEKFDFTLQKMELRKKCTLKYIQRAVDELSTVMPRKTIPELFCHTNSLILNGGYDEQDRLHLLTTAAAVWIVDQLRIQDKVDELYEILSSTEIPGHFFELPLFKHPINRHYEIEETALLLIYRNNGLYKPGSFPTPLADEWTNTPVSQRTDPSAMPLRKAFESLLELLDKEAIASAVKKYEQNVWEFYRLVFSVESHCAQALDRHEREIQRIESEIKSQWAKIKNSKGSPINPLMAQPSPLALLDMIMGPGYQQAMTPLLAEKKQHQNEVDRIQYVQSALSTSLALPNDREKYARKLHGIIPEDLEEKLVHFSAEDPYETAFALLWLLDSGSTLPWGCYYGSLSVAITAKDQLPFNALGCRLEGNAVPFMDSIENVYKHQYTYNQWPDRKDGDNEPVVRQFGMNLSQIIFRCTNTILPRLTQRTDAQLPFEQLGLETEKERMLFRLLLDSFTAPWLEPLQLAPLNTEFQSIPEAEEHTMAQQDAEDSVPLEKVAELKEALRRIKRDYHEATLDAKRILQQKKQQDAELERMRLELHDLRTIAFQQQNNAEEPPLDSQIVFPQILQKRIVSFGGHVSWLNRIRTLLPSVRFIAPDMQPSEDLLKNADEVWIQPNCLSHADFYKIMNIIRNQGIPIRYFSFASAEKCAEQLIHSTNR